MPKLGDLALVPASIRADASTLQAARLLLESHVSAVAVVDENERVIGLFTDDDLLGMLFPRYLAELHHTAFLVEELELDVFQANADALADETVGEHMREPVTVELHAGPAHVVERFLHSPWGAIAVVDDGRFVGMVGQLEFTELLLGKLSLPDD